MLDFIVLCQYVTMTLDSFNQIVYTADGVSAEGLHESRILREST